MKVFFIYTITLCFFVACSWVVFFYLKNRVINFFILRVFSICEFSVITFLISLIIKNLVVRKLLRVFIVGFILFGFIDYFLGSKDHFNNHSNLVSSFSLIIILIYFFYEKMKTVFLYPLYQSITFWLCVGFFLYFTGNFFFFLFSNYSTDKAFLNQMRVVYSLVTITKNLILGLALLANEPIDVREEELQIPKDLQLDEFTLNPTKP